MSTNENKKVIDLSIFGIKDVDDWLKEFEYPVKSSETLEVAFKISEQLNSANSQFISTSLAPHYRIATVALFRESLILLSRLILVSRLKESDKIFDLSDDVTRIIDKKTTSPKSSVYNLYNNIKFSYKFKSFSVHSKQRYGLKGKIKKLHHLYKLRKIRRTKIAFCSCNSYLLSYAKKYHSNQIYFIDTDIVLAEEVQETLIFNDSELSLITNFSNDFVSSLKSIYKEYVNGFDFENLFSKFKLEIDSFLIKIGTDLKKCNKFLVDNSLAGIDLYTGTANYTTRILSESLRKFDGKVMGFPHGGGWAGVNTPSYHFVELATCDKFACYSEKEKSQFLLYPKINKIKFEVIERLELSILDLTSKKKSTNKIDTLMIVPPGIRFDILCWSMPPDILSMEFEISLIKHLLSLDKKIIYKNHKKSKYFGIQQRHCNYFFEENVEYNDKPFSEVLNNSDAFIFYHVMSSALYEAMVYTDKPIFLFLPKCYKYTDDYYNSVAKRCIIIELEEDERNRLCFDKEYFNELLIKFSSESK